MIHGMNVKNKPQDITSNVAEMFKIVYLTSQFSKGMHISLMNKKQIV